MTAEKEEPDLKSKGLDYKFSKDLGICSNKSCNILDMKAPNSISKTGSIIASDSY